MGKVREVARGSWESGEELLEVKDACERRIFSRKGGKQLFEYSTMLRALPCDQVRLAPAG